MTTVSRVPAADTCTLLARGVTGDMHSLACGTPATHTADTGFPDTAHTLLAEALSGWLVATWCIVQPV